MSDSASWQPFGSKYIRQTTIYSATSTRWDTSLDFSECVIAHAPFGGPVALTRDASRLVDMRGGVDDDIAIYSAAGELYARVPRDEEAGSLVLLAWSGKEMLYVVYESGVVDVCVWRAQSGGCLEPRARHATRSNLIKKPVPHSPLPLLIFHSTFVPPCFRGRRFDILGVRSSSSFSLLSSLSSETVVAAALSRDALAAVVTSSDGVPSVHVVDGLANPNPIILPETGLPPGTRRPKCIAVIDGAATAQGRAEVFLGGSEAGIVVLDSGGDAPRFEPLPSVPMLISVSPEQKYFAVFCEDASLQALDVVRATRAQHHSTSVSRKSNPLPSHPSHTHPLHSPNLSA